MLYVASLHNHAIVASGMYHNVFIKTENKVVGEIEKKYMLTSTSTRSYIFLNNIIISCMHDTATYNIVVINSTVQ